VTDRSVSDHDPKAVAPCRRERVAVDADPSPEPDAIEVSSYTVEDALQQRGSTDTRAWLDECIAAVVDSGRELCVAVNEAVAALADARRQHQAGAGFVDAIVALLESDPRKRRVMAEMAIARYEHSTMQLRARVVRTLVDEDGMTLTAVARRLRISRQMAARLYHSRSEASSSETQPDSGYIWLDP
jgi:hypothetical protein